MPRLRQQTQSMKIKMSSSQRPVNRADIQTGRSTADGRSTNTA